MCQLGQLTHTDRVLANWVYIIRSTYNVSPYAGRSLLSFLPPENHVHLREERIWNPLGLQASLLLDLTFNLEPGYLLSWSCRISNVLQTLVIFILAIIIQSSLFPRNCHLILLLLVLVRFMQPIFQGTLAQNLCADPFNCVNQNTEY